MLLCSPNINIHEVFKKFYFWPWLSIRERIYSVTLKNEIDKTYQIIVFRHGQQAVQESYQWEKSNKRDEPYDFPSWCLERIFRLVCWERKSNRVQKSSLGDKTELQIWTALVAQNYRDNTGDECTSHRGQAGTGRELWGAEEHSFGSSVEYISVQAY